MTTEFLEMFPHTPPALTLPVGSRTHPGSIMLELSALQERSENRSIADILKAESAKSNRRRGPPGYTGQGGAADHVPGLTMD